jgi:hypothetical protein
MALSQEFADYNRTMARLNVYGSTLDALNGGGYTITLTTRTWNKGSRQAFARNPDTTETESITARQYACFVSSVGFFRDRVSNGYTPVGYVPVRLTCYSPDRTTMIERTFRIVYDTPPWS